MAAGYDISASNGGAAGSSPSPGNVSGRLVSAIPEGLDQGGRVKPPESPPLELPTNDFSFLQRS
jgi:hypothetical protein